MVKFREEGHLYQSVDNSDIKWLGVTSLCGRYKEPFPQQERAEKCSIRKPTVRYPNKWYGTSAEEIIRIWNNESKRSTDLGHWYHQYREKEILSKGYVDGLPVIRSQYDGEWKMPPVQKLTDGIYPEHLVYIPNVNICGQADIVRVEKGKITIQDFKTNKEINRRGYENWEGVRKKMLSPIHHLEDCHLTHYGLQLSMYMYAITRFNPQLEPGEMFIDHITFRKTGDDKWGYPVTYYNENGEPEVENIERIPLPYLKNEVRKIIDHIKNERQTP